MRCHGLSRFRLARHTYITATGKDVMPHSRLPMTCGIIKPLYALAPPLSTDYTGKEDCDAENNKIVASRR